MPQKLKLAASQSRTLSSTVETLRALEETTRKAAQQGARLILFPEAYLGGYPRTCSFGAAVGGREPIGREQFLEYFKQAVDLGDTPQGSGDAWVNKSLPLPRGEKLRGDGIREELERIARDTDTFVVTGLIERAGGSLYCAVVYVDPKFGVLGKRRKVMPTGSERLIWAQGSPSTLKAVTTIIDGVKLTLAAAICWENYMPMLRQSLYSQNVNLYLAPTADPRPTWEGLMTTVASEGRAWVLSCNMCTQRKHLPAWITQSQNKNQGSTARKSTEQTPSTTGQRRRTSTITALEDGNELCLPLKSQQNGEPAEANGHASAVSAIDETPDEEAPEDGDEFVSRGGSLIVSPFGEVKAGPVWDKEELLVVECDFEDCLRGRLDLDVGGSYSRNDAFKLTVEGLDLDPPA
jgi:nitrilase